jgi:ABC-2 type transport system permease protein
MTALRAEWTKLRTVRGTVWALAATLVVSIALTALIATFFHTDGGPVRGDSPQDTVLISLSGTLVSQIIVAALGVVAITSEYATGTIRATFAASPRRYVVLAAKAGVLAAAVLGAGLLASLGSFFAGSAILPSGGFTPANGYETLSLADGATLRAVTGGALYLALLALLGLGIGAIARQTGAALTAMLGLMLLPVLIAGVIGGDAGWTLQKLAPMTAGLCVQATVPGAPLGPAAGLGVAGAWAAGALLVAFVLTARRDV